MVIPLRAFLRDHNPAARTWRASLLNLSVRQAAEPQDLVSALVEVGYARAPVVEDVGTFATRGGILDVYPQGVDNPVRIELVGDQIESLREFDPFSQRSVKKIDSVRILPAREVVLSDRGGGAASWPAWRASPCKGAGGRGRGDPRQGQVLLRRHRGLRAAFLLRARHDSVLPPGRCPLGAGGSRRA